MRTAAQVYDIYVESVRKDVKSDRLRLVIALFLRIKEFDSSYGDALPSLLATPDEIDGTERILIRDLRPHFIEWLADFYGRTLAQTRDADDTAAKAVESARKRDEALPLARATWNATRKARAENNQALLEKAVAALFDKPDKPGWGWTNPEITEFLSSRFPDYTVGSLLKKVKHEAAKQRKRRKLRSRA